MLRLAILCLVAATLLSLPLRPLWVDELYQLEATRDLSVGGVLHSSMVAPGGMPLGYLAQKLWLSIAGFSPAEARVPAALFGLGAAFVTAWVARLLSLNPTLTLLLSLITPLLFRYSTEARPYSQGLFFSVLSTALFLSWLKDPSKAKWIAYLLSAIAGIYSQPFSLFTVIAHALYSLFADRKRFGPILAVIVLTSGAYAPWFALSQKAMKHEGWPQVMFFSWRQISPFMILKEISGGGYVCSVALLLLILAGLRTNKYPLLWCCFVIPVILAITTDAMFNYFFAIRQLIFVVPPLLLLTIAAAEQLWQHRKIAVGLLAGIYVVGAIVKDVNWQRDGRENWGTAAATITSRLQETHGCVTFPFGDSVHYYFFQPFLRNHTCQPRAQQYHELIALSPYAPVAKRRSLLPAQLVGGTLIKAAAN